MSVYRAPFARACVGEVMTGNQDDLDRFFFGGGGMPSSGCALRTSPSCLRVSGERRQCVGGLDAY